MICFLVLNIYKYINDKDNHTFEECTIFMFVFLSLKGLTWIFLGEVGGEREVVLLMTWMD